MKDIIIIRSIFLFMCVWGITCLLVWFRPRIELFWKIVATAIFAFYLWFFWDEILRDFSAFKITWYTSFLTFGKDLLTLVFANFFMFWPLTLIVVFYKADDIGAEKVLKFICLLTLVLWLVFVVYFYFDKGINTFFNATLKKMIPHAR